MQRPNTFTHNAAVSHSDKETNTRSLNFFFWYASLVILPLVLAGLFMLSMNIQEMNRYDAAQFTPELKEKYFSPGEVGRGLGQAIRSGDSALYAELTGVNNPPILEAAEPNVVFTVLLEVDEQDYFHYMYFDVNTYDRQTHYIKEIDGRWVVSPEDAYFYYDSGLWLGVFGPLLATWWLLMFVFLIGKIVYSSAARSREQMGRA